MTDNLSPQLEAYLRRKLRRTLAEAADLEELLGIPKTSDARKYAKSHGWITGPNINYTHDLDAAEEQSG